MRTQIGSKKAGMLGPAPLYSICLVSPLPPLYSDVFPSGGTD